MADRFLYQGREVSYSSILDHSICARREALYKSRGLDIELWMDLVSDQRSLRREIKRIAEDYEHQGREEAQKDEPKVQLHEGKDREWGIVKDGTD